MPDFLVNLQDARQILPAAGRHKITVFRFISDAVEMFLPDLKIAEDRAVNSRLVGVLPECVKVHVDVDLPDTVKGDDIKIAHGFVVLRRIARRDNHPSLRNPVRAEGLVLQELKHGRCERLRDTVDLIEKEDSLPDAAALHLLIDGSDDLTHRVFRDRIRFSAVLALPDEGKSDGALPRVMRDRVGNKVDVRLFRYLLHDGGFPDSGRPHQQNRALPLRRNRVLTRLVLHKISLNRAEKFLFCLFDIHKILVSASRFIQGAVTTIRTLPDLRT